LITDPDTLAAACLDWRGRYRGRAQAIARPGSTAEVAALVRACVAAGAPIVPQGGNTSHCGAATPDDSGRALIIQLHRMQALRAVDADNNTLTAEAGCTLAQVQDAAAGVGRLFPLSLASEGSCQIGGNLATNAGGVAVLRYGPMRELTLGLEAVLPDGSVLDSLSGLRKNNTGYDLKQLLIGAEGTLGIITAATLKLFPAPDATATALVEVGSPADALALLHALQARFGDRLTAFELISGLCLQLLARHLPAPMPAPLYQRLELDTYSLPPVASVMVPSVMLMVTAPFLLSPLLPLPMPAPPYLPPEALLMVLSPEILISVSPETLEPEPMPAPLSRES
jgi:FAD/FMN-containing dehydrogenase